MKTLVGCLVALVFMPAVVAEQTWELRAEFESLRPGPPEVVVLRPPDGRPVEVPLAALSAAGQAAVRRAAAAAATESDGERVVIVRGPFGKSVTVPVPESIKLVEGDAIHCRTAADAADVYRLALADERLSGEPRRAAEGRLREWAALAEKGSVRLGDRWVSPEEARAAADEADKMLHHAFELMRLGNGKQAAAELQKSRRTNPESGRAGFVIGLGYALLEKDFVKAAEHFAEVARLDPDDPAALNNLAVAEMRVPRFASAVEHFRAAVERAADPLPAMHNVTAAMKLAGGAGARMPAKAVQELDTLYRLLIQDMKLKSADGAADLRFVGPDNVFCTASSPSDVARLCESNFGKPVARRSALGFVVAPGFVVCPRRLLVGSAGALLDDITIQAGGGGDQRLAAVVVAAPDDGEVALLRCEGLALQALPLADSSPPSEIVVVDRAGGTTGGAVLRAARGKIIAATPEAQARGRFMHTAAVTRGFGGGPIVDSAGRVVGMTAATYPTNDAGNPIGYGLSAGGIRRLVDGHVEALPAEDSGQSDVASVERLAVERTVVVLAAAKPAGQQGPPR